MTEGVVDSEDERAIRAVILRYATAIDGRDWAALRSCFTRDVHADYGEIGVWFDADELTEWMRVVHEACGHTLHRLSNILITPAMGGRIAAQTYVDAIVLGPDDLTGVQALGIYEDELVETGDGWRIAHRIHRSRFTQPVGGFGSS